MAQGLVSVRKDVRGRKKLEQRQKSRGALCQSLMALRHANPLHRVTVAARRIHTQDCCSQPSVPANQTLFALGPAFTLG